MFEERKKKKNAFYHTWKREFVREKFVKILEEGEGHIGKDSQYTYTI